MKLTKDLVERIDHVAFDIETEPYIGGALITKQQADDIEFLAGVLSAIPNINTNQISVLMEIIGRKDKCNGFNT